MILAVCLLTPQTDIYSEMIQSCLSVFPCILNQYTGLTVEEHVLPSTVALRDQQLLFLLLMTHQLDEQSSSLKLLPNAPKHSGCI